MKVLEHTKKGIKWAYNLGKPEIYPNNDPNGIKNRGLKSIGMWFNDQPANPGAGHDAGFYSPQKALEASNELKNKKYKWKNAHSKVCGS